MKPDFLKIKKAEMTTVAIVKIILSVIGIGILLYLLVSMYSLVGDRNKLESQRNLLKDFISKTSELNEEKLTSDYTFLGQEDQYLFTFESSKTISECSIFCLCICDEVDCSDERACFEAPKFILLRNLQGKDSRLIKIEETVTKFKLDYFSEEVYIYNAGAALESFTFSTKATTPLFYKFEENKWVWTPDLKNWMPVPQTKVVGGVFDGRLPSTENQKFIQLLSSLSKQGTDKALGEKLFLDLEVVPSKGLVTSQMLEADS